MIALSVFIAAALAFLAIRLLYRRVDLSKLVGTVSFSAPRAVEGSKLVLTTVLTNTMWLPMPWVAVKLKVSMHLIFADMENANVTDYFYRHDLYNMLMRQRITRRLSFVCGKRGYYHIPHLDVTAFDILMENKNAAKIKCNARLTVYPSFLPVPEVDNLCVQIYGHLRARNIIHPDPFSFRGIREYTPGDPLKAINFKASAKAQDLMVNLWEYMNARQVILLFNLQRHNRWHNEVLDEYAIKLVASLAERLVNENVPVRFITNGQREKTDEEPICDEFTKITEGVGDIQLERILEALAHIDLTQTEVSSFSEILSSTAVEHKYEPEYWLISTYHGPDLEEAYKSLIAQGARTVWILPRSTGVRLSDDEITLSQEIREQVILL